MDREEAEALAEAASEAVASEAADMAVADIAPEDLVAAHTARVDRMVREARILDGALARAMADGTADPITEVADALAVFWD